MFWCCCKHGGAVEPPAVPVDSVRAEVYPTATGSNEWDGFGGTTNFIGAEFHATTVPVQKGLAVLVWSGTEGELPPTYSLVEWGWHGARLDTLEPEDLDSIYVYRAGWAADIGLVTAQISSATGTFSDPTPWPTTEPGKKFTSPNLATVVNEMRNRPDFPNGAGQTPSVWVMVSQEYPETVDTGFYARYGLGKVGGSGDNYSSLRLET